MSNINIARKSIKDFHDYSKKLSKFGLQVDYDSQLVVSITGEHRSNLTDDMKTTDELKSFFYGYQAGVERTSKEAFINLDMLASLEKSLEFVERIKAMDVKSEDYNYKHQLQYLSKELESQIENTKNKKAKAV